MPQKLKNAARSVLMSGIIGTSTSITLDASKADLFPVADTGTSPIPTAGKDWFKVVLQDNTGEIEIVYVRTRASGSATLTNCIRGQEGTTAKTFLAGSIVEVRITADDISAAIDLGSGTSSFWRGVLASADAAISRTALGISTIGNAIVTAANAAAARAALGFSTIGNSIATAADAAAARAAIGAAAGDGSGAALAAPWSGISGKPSSLAGYGIPSSDVLSATAAAAAVGGVGTYAFARPTYPDSESTTEIVAGSQRAGSGLQAVGAPWKDGQTVNGGVTAGGGPTFSGTWRCMGSFYPKSGDVGGGYMNFATLWLRIA